MSLEKEFIPYEQALALKELGFDEPCFGRFYTKPKCKMFSVDEKGRHYQIKNTPKKLYTVGEYFVLNDDNAITAPTFSQAFRRFRDKYEYGSLVRGRKSMGFEYILSDVPTNLSKRDTVQSPHVYKTYEEAELACLRKLIEIVKEKQNEKQ